jgi:hypothetical protein
MAKPFEELVPVNYYIRLPGFADGIHSRRLRFDPWRGRLIVQTPHGVVTFDQHSDIMLAVLDLSTPLFLRLKDPGEGWSSVAIADFINLLLLDHQSY